MQQNYERDIRFLKRSLISSPIRLKLSLFHDEKILCRCDFFNLLFLRNAAKCSW